MRFAFVMDPLSTVHHQKDTSFAFIRAAQERGHESYHCLPRDLSIADGEAHALVHRVVVIDTPPYIAFEHERGRHQVRLSDLDAIFIRKDPPFDRSYLYATLMLERARTCPVILNDPRGLRDANEKLYALNFPEWTPRTIVTTDVEQIHAFAREVGDAVIKPLDGAGGMGVLRLSPGDKNARAIADMLTGEGRRLAMVQEYLPAVVQGDKRVLLLDGEPLGAILRVPRSDDLRSNIHVGGSVVPAELTPREQEMVRALAPRLRADGLHFVGLDVIGERLTEVNVTSPTGIQELSRFTSVDHAAKVIAWTEDRVRAVRG